MARIDLIKVRKAWGEVVAVDDMNLQIADGEFVAILGPSGCGKSTTLFMLAGIYAPSGGEIRFDDRRVNEVEARDRNVGIVFQSYALYPHLSVRANIGFPLKFQSVGKDQARQRVDQAAEMVRVDELLERKPAQLSGGQQQRVALARALVKRPQLLLLDEPLSNLDATLRLQMRTEIKRLQRRLGVTAVLVTHDQIEATTMADRVICMRRGTVEQVGTAQDLYLRPASLFVARFVGAPPINTFNGRAQDGRLQVDGLSLPLSGGGPSGSVVAGIRPEHIVFSEHGIEACIEQVEPMGRETLYVLDTPLGALNLLATGAVCAPGERKKISWRADTTLLFDAADQTRLAGVRVGLPVTA